MIECRVTTISRRSPSSLDINLHHEPMRFETRPVVGERIMYKNCTFKVVDVIHVPDEYDRTLISVEQTGPYRFT